MEAKRLARIISQIRIAMLTTVNEDGSMHSRPMANQEIDIDKFDGTLWFFTRKDTFKVIDIQKDQHVNLTYTHPERQQYVSISGKAILSEDKDFIRDLWSESLKEWFPLGHADPELALIRVQIENAEIWDSTNTGRFLPNEAQKQQIHLQH